MDGRVKVTTSEPNNWHMGHGPTAEKRSGTTYAGGETYKHISIYNYIYIYVHICVYLLFCDLRRQGSGKTWTCRVAQDSKAT